MNKKKYDIIFSILLVLQTDTWAYNESVIPKIPPLKNDLFEFSLPSGEGNTKKVTMIRYKAKIYELAYVTYLQNRNIKNAYAVAAAAVAQNPNDKLWRSRLAQVAIWNQEPTIALQQYLYLVKHFNDIDAEVKGIALAKSMHEDQALAELLLFSMTHGNNSESTWRDYVTIMLRLGEIDKLIDVLNANQRQLSEKFYLETFARIYFIVDDPDSEQKMLVQLSKKIGVTPEIAQQLSSIYLNQGNIKLAAQVMSQARDKASPTDYKFWEIYARMAYLNDDPAAELHAYQLLVKQPNAEISIYSRLDELTLRDHPDLAKKYVMEGKQKYPNDYTLTLDAFALIASQNQSLDFPKLLASTPESVQKMLRYDSTFWNARASYYKLMGDEDEVIQSYLTGINYSPNYYYLKSNLLFYLIEQHDLAKIKEVLPLWQDNLPNTPDLWGAYAQSYALLNDRFMTRLILELFYDQFENYKNNPQWLIAFKDHLENSFFDVASAEISRYVWPIYVNYIKQQKGPLEYSQLLNYVKLSMLNAAGDPSAAALAELQNTENVDTELLMLNWAIKQNNFSLAKAIYWHYESIGIFPPLWASLSIALERRDRNWEKRILTNKEANVSYRDRVRAATDIDAIPMAQSTAYEGLKLHRHDHDLYDNFFTPIMLRTSNNFYFGQEYYQYGNVEGPRTNASFTYFLTPGISLTPYTSTWFSRNKPGGVIVGDDDPNNTTNQVLATVPAHDQRQGVRIHTQQRRGNLDVDLGYRTNLDSFFTAKAMRTYPLYGDLNSYIGVGYHQPADDTAGMLVGGMKNNLEFGLAYNLFVKDTLFGNFNQSAFYTQDRQYLADGSQGTIRWEHKFWKSYPDWTIAPYGVITQYYNKTDQLLYGNILTLVPDQVIPNVNFLIPANSTEYGVTLSFGQSYIEDYTHRWRPFASATVSQNSNVGLGKLFNAGIAGTVFGRDHLLFYYEWGTNQGQGLQTARLLKVSYQIYM